MRWSRWALLLIVYICYLLIGGAAFFYLENPEACRQKKSLKEDERQLSRLITQYRGMINISKKSLLS